MENNSVTKSVQYLEVFHCIILPLCQPPVEINRARDRGGLLVFRDASQLAQIPSASLSAIFRRFLIIIRPAGREPESLHSFAHHPDSWKPKKHTRPPTKSFGQNFLIFFFRLVIFYYCIIYTGHLYNTCFVLCACICRLTNLNTISVIIMWCVDPSDGQLHNRHKYII